MYAIIEVKGKQYKVQEGDLITVEKLNFNDGEKFVIDSVLGICNDLLVVGDDVSNAKVETEVVCSYKDKKIIVYKYKAKKGFHKKNGYRKKYTKLKILKINI